MFKSGNLEWKDLFEPVIKMLSEGVMINSVLAGALDGVAKDILDFDDTLKSVFAKNATAVKVQNDTYFNPHLLKTLQIIADDPRGIFEFYHGQIAKDLVQDIKDGGWSYGWSLGISFSAHRPVQLRQLEVATRDGNLLKRKRPRLCSFTC